MKGFIKEEEKDLSNIFHMIRKWKFKGYTGLAVKNSIYQFSTTLIAKIGSLIFTIIMARLLLPELFGLYSLALSTILVFSVFSDLGVSNALIVFLSKGIKKKSYYNKLLKLKLKLLFLSSLILLLVSYFVSNYYYDKPIFYALLAGAIYILFGGLTGFLESGFKALNKFKQPLINEIIFQILRFSLIPLLTLYLLKISASNEIIIFYIILIVSFCYFLRLLFLWIISKKQFTFLIDKKEILSLNEEYKLKKFILPLSAMALSGVFFGYTDIIMLGYFVSEKFIGYYSGSFSLITAASTIIGFAGAALMPIFSKLKGARLKRGFRKSTSISVLISIFSFIFVLKFSSIIIKIVFGNAYLQAVPLLKLFSVLLIIIPLNSIYQTYFISQKRTKILAKLLILSSILNIIFNYIFIKYVLSFGEFYGIFGAGIATIFSQILFFVGLWVFKER
jgi:O-antigen/teichoic acid export membrane protein